MFGLRNKSPGSAPDAPAGPLERIGRRNPEPRSDSGPQPAPVDRDARLTEATARLADMVGPRLRSLIAAGSPAGEVTRQAGVQAQVHFRSHGVMLSPLELRRYVTEVLRPILPATNFSAPEPVAEP